MSEIRQIRLIAEANYRRWQHNPQIILCFSLGFILCFLLSDKVLSFAQEHDTVLQCMEPFIWTFGDANAILIISLLLLLLFADMPHLGNEVPFYLIRINRKTWLMGQVVYLVTATFGFISFIFLSTCVLAGGRSYTANLWSETAAILGYSGIGNEIAIPAFVKVLELSFPYKCTLHIYGLMLGYSLLMASLILCLNLWSKKLGMIGGILFSSFGFVLNPEFIAKVLKLPQEQMRMANILFGWLSPLNHATYYMHNFGYDNLPKLWVSYLFFILGSLVLLWLSFKKMKNYTFEFTGTGK
ncbi:hypothetical protein [Frisingicoccus sp.]|uniref:hypothetical protein n=1 Tax=Frisingicoccus sp. TaxID=1918627 RepID=UPI002EAC2960|nr:hypothetical protein [Frisingicoccus sp.]